MAIYKIKRFSFKDKFKGAMKGAAQGAGVGGLLSSVVAVPILSVSPKTSLAVASGSAALGGIIGGRIGWKNARESEIPESTKPEDIIVNEPNNLRQLIQKYPKLKELSPFIDHKDELYKIAMDMDSYRILVDWESMNLDLDNEDDMYKDTKFIRSKLGSNSWISCLGRSLCFNTKDNSFYLVDPYDSYGPRRKKITIKEYEKDLIDCIDEGVMNAWFDEEEIPPKIRKVIKEDKQKLKKIFNL